MIVPSHLSQKEKIQSLPNKILVEIGKKHGKNAVQVVLRWLIQRGIVVIPKSIHLERMVQNFDVFDFELTAEDMKYVKILSLN